MRSLGIHIVADLYGCNRDLLLRREIGEQILREAVTSSGLNHIMITSHQFEPAGYTAAAVLTESHITIHTWPELSAALLDIFTCGREDSAFKALDILIKHFQPDSIRQKVIRRGTDVRSLQQRAAANTAKLG